MSSWITAAVAALTATASLVAPAAVPAADTTGTTGTGAAAEPVAGKSGIGDPYWPLDGNGGIDVRHYDIDVAYDFDTGRLTGTTTVTLRTRAALRSFHLDLLLPTTSVTVDGVAARTARPGPHELRIVPATPLRRGETVDVVVDYAGRPGPVSYAGEANWLADDREVVTMNEPHMAPWWFPANDHPRDKATFEVSVEGPAGMQAVSNGRPVGRAVDGDTAVTRWRTDRPMTTYLAFFALGRYEVRRTERDGLPSYVAVSKEIPQQQRAAGLRLLNRSGEITAWLTRRLGPYPFESTGGLMTSLPVGFALENQTRPTYPVVGEGAVSLVVHELAHQWYGDSVAVRGWRDIWLNEGFATFLEVAFDERHGGPTGREWLRRTYGAYAAADREFWGVVLDDPGAHRIFSDAVYTRGAMALQALRERVGDRLFWRTLRGWAAQHRHGNASVAQFERYAAQVTGQRLDGFFDAWLRAPRKPEPTRANGLR